MNRKKEDFSFSSWKEKWQDISQRNRYLSEEFSNMISEAGEKISQVSAKATTQAKETIDERRKRKEMQKLMNEIDQMVAVSSQKPIDEKEVARLRLRVATLEIKQKEQENLIDQMNNLVYDIPEDNLDLNISLNDKIPILNNNLGFFTTIRKTPNLIGFAALWTLIVVISGEYAEGIESEIFGYKTSIFVWIFGAMIWSYLVLTQVSSAGSFNDLPLQFRLQATLGVGISTMAIYILPGLTNMSPMFHIYAWLVMVALTIISLSAVVNGLNSLRK